MEGQIKSNSGDINCPASSICQLVEETVLEPADKSGTYCWRKICFLYITTQRFQRYMDEIATDIQTLSITRVFPGSYALNSSDSAMV